MKIGQLRLFGLKNRKKKKNKVNIIPETCGISLSISTLPKGSTSRGGEKEAETIFEGRNGNWSPPTSNEKY